MMQVKFFRFSPRLSKDSPLDCTDEEILEMMVIMETKSFICYLVIEGKIKKIACVLRLKFDFFVVVLQPKKSTN
ncbi:hypothetical protein DPMN_037742 [Dreissena polymorpha]|uniref:Uncharacterized protein n=1 Tax=Dreissena polymorpha TaxID=45954 RepID=A0A9D4MFM6_DREPO|nr:hypothetical protein DPMN_037742 [Dreissena polymorpha]